MKFTHKQEEAQRIIAGDAKHIMLFGGSRSGKTFLFTRNIVMRALKAPGSRHGIFRFRLSHVKQSVALETFPKVMRLAFPGVEYSMNKTDWFAEMPGGSEIWFGGLDDKDRTEKVLGKEFATLFLNECSQIPWSSVGIVTTRLAQNVEQRLKGRDASPLKLRMYYDCNPPSKAHWAYRLFIEKRDPETKQNLADPSDYVHLQMNPTDNAENLPAGYIETLKALGGRMRKRFLEGQFSDATPNALFADDVIERCRVTDGVVPDLVRVVVAVDPSGSGDADNADNDAIGIIVCGLGVDGNAYVLEDCTVKAGPATWGNVATTAFERHAADVVVGETNYGGAMVRHVIQTARPRTPYKEVHASRGKVVRAEPIAALYEQGKVRHVGYFGELEDEMSAFSTMGYLGDRSPNRADALIWCLTELFPGIVREKREPYKPKPKSVFPTVSQGWMA